MNHQPAASLTPAVMLNLLREHRYVWIAPAVAGLVLAAFVSFVVPRQWSARQGLIVRSEAAGYSDQRLGKFTDLSEMKTVQETLLELAQSQSVVSAVLEEVGPSGNLESDGYPSRRDVARFRKRLTITPPGGAEFGMTEVFYLEVEDNSPERAKALVAALADQLELRLQALRDQRAGSMVEELEESVAVAKDGLAESVNELGRFEASLGANLGELRSLVSPVGGQSALDQQASAIQQELRAIDAARRQNEHLLETLSDFDDGAERLLATPSALLTSQPALLRLKEGLVDAQIKTASLLGTRSADHPYVHAARETEERMREEINREAPLAVRGVEMELAVADSREAALRDRLAELCATQGALAQKRARYAQLVADVETQTRLVDAARKQLTDARATRAGAQESSVLARIDKAESGLYPVGLSRKATTLAGGVAGLLAGLGAVFLFFAPKPAPLEHSGGAAVTPVRQYYDGGRAHVAGGWSSAV